MARARVAAPAPTKPRRPADWPTELREWFVLSARMAGKPEPSQAELDERVRAALSLSSIVASTRVETVLALNEADDEEDWFGI